MDQVRVAIASGEAIYLAEGEGKANALLDMLRNAASGAAVTTLFGGANARLTDAHLASLSDATDVIVLADSDHAGRSAAATRAKRIASAYASWPSGS